MSRVSISELSELTGLHRPVLADRLRGVPYVDYNNAKLYDSRDVLPLLYGAGTIDAPADQKTRLLMHQANMAALKEEEMRGNLVPISEVLEYLGGVIRVARGRLLPLGGMIQARVTELHEIESELNSEVRLILQEMADNTKYGEPQC